MVDTINTTPNNDKPVGDSQHFYSGFGRPDEVTVNLAAEHKDMTKNSQSVEGKTPEAVNVATPSIVTESKTVDPAPTPVSPSRPVPIAETQSAVAPQTPPIRVADLEGKARPNHQTTYAHTVPREPIEWKKSLIVFGGGILIAIFLSVGSFTIFGYLNQNKINNQDAKLNELNDKLQKLNQAPTPLVIPEITPPASSVPVVETPKVEVVPVEQPAVVTPAPTTPSIQEDGSQDAQG
jgi:hypothetical protein